MLDSPPILYSTLALTINRTRVQFNIQATPPGDWYFSIQCFPMVKMRNVLLQCHRLDRIGRGEIAVAGWSVVFNIDGAKIYVGLGRAKQHLP